jgi:KDEL-tailed cysteine endopeptidase
MLLGSPVSRLQAATSLVLVHAVPRYNAYALLEAAARQPVSVAVQASGFAFQHYRGGVLTGSCGADVDHGVLLVGYGHDSVGGDYWKVKNSWSPYWGERGYIRIKRDMSWYPSAGKCGILTMNSYPEPNPKQHCATL